MADKYKPPYPYFGGKYTIKDLAWPYFGNDLNNFVDPFFGGGSSLWFNPAYNWSVGNWEPGGEIIETINDALGFVSNFWRSVKHNPQEVAKHLDRPVNENDLHAIHLYLVNNIDELSARLEADIDYFDARIAGYWVWGMCAWIGAHFASGNGPWSNVDGLFVKSGQGINRQRPHLGDVRGINRKLPHLGNNGRGINRKRPHLGNNGRGINRQLPHLGDNGQGIKRQLPHLGNNGQGINRQLPDLGDNVSQAEAWTNWYIEYMQALSNRLRRVRVCSGDWERVVTNTPTSNLGTTGIFFDPPYASSHRDDVYTIDSFTIAHDVEQWCLKNQDNEKLRIVLCGYDKDYRYLDWERVKWKANSGYGRSNGNENKEVLLISPHCVKQAKYEQPMLFGEG